MDRGRHDAVRVHERDARGAIESRIAARNLNGRDIDIGGDDVAPQGTRRGNRQNAGAGANIKNAPRRAGSANVVERDEAAARRAVMAGAEGKRRFDLDADAVARDVAAVVRAVSGLDPADYDVHINIIGGGNIDGPSAGLAIFLALYSALTKTPLPQDIAITGELSIQGKVRPVGGIVEKLYAARQAGMRAILVPKENIHEIDRSLAGIDVIPIASVEQAFRALTLHKKSTRRATRGRRNTSARP